jgi:branched-chain amino acid transport system permease protein
MNLPAPDGSGASGLNAKDLAPGAFERGARQKRSWDAFWGGLPKEVRWLIMAAFLAIAYLIAIPENIPVISTTKSNFIAVLATKTIIYVLVALGLNVVVGMAGLLDLGYVGFYAVGAYVLGILTSQHATVPWLICVPIAIAVSALSGIILGGPTLRLRGDYLAIVTLGFGEIIRLVAEETPWLGEAAGISNIKRPPSVGPANFSPLPKDLRWYYWLGLTICIVVYFLLRRMERSRVGRALTAIREDEDAAELMGVPTFKFKLLAFALGAAIGGLAGLLYAGQVAFISPQNFQLETSILFLAAVVLGGPGNMPGVVLGAVVVTYLPEKLRVDPDSTFWLARFLRWVIPGERFDKVMDFQAARTFWFGLALVLMMIFRPQGLIPKRLKERKAEANPNDRLAANSNG